MLHIKQKALKGREVVAKQLGTSVSKEWHSSEFSGFSFCLSVPKLELEANSLEMSTSTGKESPHKSLLSLASGVD